MVNVVGGACAADLCKFCRCVSLRGHLCFSQATMKIIRGMETRSTGNHVGAIGPKVHAIAIIMNMY